MRSKVTTYEDLTDNDAFLRKPHRCYRGCPKRRRDVWQRCPECKKKEWVKQKRMEGWHRKYSMEYILASYDAANDMQ